MGACVAFPAPFVTLGTSFGASVPACAMGIIALLSLAGATRIHVLVFGEGLGSCSNGSCG